MISVYAAEREAGLTELIRANASIAYCTQLEAIEPDTHLRSVAASLPDRAEASVGDDDLFFLKDILVTVGKNKNDDIFTRESVWKARHSSDDKPLNFEHDRTDVIGHIVDSYAVDDDMKVIDEATAEVDLPDKFHVVNGTVIYRILVPKNEAERTRSEEIEQTIAEIKEGEWFVSMECQFYQFDYAVTDPDGRDFVVARSEDTSWLTKYLRAYPPKVPSVTNPYLGSGKFIDSSTGSEYKVARIPRDIVFSGKGLVRRPANPESIIFNSVAAFSPVASATVYAIAETKSLHVENVKMSDEVQALQAKLTEANQTIASLNEQINAIKNQGTEARLNALAGDVEAKVAEVTSLTAQLNTVKEAVASTTTRAETAEVALAEATQKLAEIATEKLTAARIALAVEKGAEAAVAKTLVANLASLSEEAFASTVEVLAPSWVKTTVVVTKKSDTEVIDKAVLESEASLVVTPEVESETAFAAISDYLANTVLTLTQKKRS